MLSSIRKGISLTICLSLVTITPAPLFAQGGISRAEEVSNFTADFNLPAMQDYDPMIKEFANSPWTIPNQPKFEAKDVVLDQDPYFMRSQKYQTAFSHPAGEGTAFRIGRGEIEIHVPGAQQSLVLSQPLAPLFEVENFLVLQATDAKLFANKSTGPDSYGEGLFFIDKRYIYAEMRKAGDRRPVPVFFIPLEGPGWTGKIKHISIGPATTFAMQNDSGESTTLDLQQIVELARLLHNNVVMATVMALKSDVRAIQSLRAKFLTKGGDGSLELPFVYPPRGSTAVFGLFFTGLDLDVPSRGLHPIKNNSSWNLSLLPSAYASDLLSPDLLQRLLVISEITGATLIVGWIAQHTVLRGRMKERRALIEREEDKLAVKKGLTPRQRTGTMFNVKSELKETVDVFSHGLAALASGFGVATGFILEYGADRFMGHVGRNGLVRKFLEKTFVYSRKQNELIGANWNTFFLGVVILGGIDTVSVVLQLLYVSPIFFPFVARMFSEDLEQKAIAQFSGNDASTNNNVTSEIMRNLSGYFVHGAYSYSSSQRQSLLEIVRPEVESQMAKEGKEIHDPRHSAEYNARIETRLEMMLVERGLPTNDEFLFSSPSLMRALAGLMGYKADRAKLYRSKDYKRSDGTLLTEEEKAVLTDKKEWARRINSRLERLIADAAKYPENAVAVERFAKGGQKLQDAILVEMEKQFDKESFVLEKARFGLVSHALKRAHAAAIEIAAEHPEDPRLKAAVGMLKETQRRYHFVIETVKRPWKALANGKDALKVREMLTYMSYEGDVVGNGVKYLDLWADAKTSPEGAQIAARYFRQALFGLIQDKPEFLKPSVEDLAKYLPEAKQQAEQIVNAAPKQVGFEDSDKDIIALEIVKEKIQDVEAKGKAATWTPPAPGYLEIVQRANAQRAAMIKVMETPGIQMEMTPAVQAALAAKVDVDEQILVQSPVAAAVYREEYRKAMAEQVGLVALNPNESELVRKSMEAAEKDVELNQKNNAGWKEYLADLNDLAKIRFLTHQYADSFLAKYVESTVSNSSAVSLISPEQPGFFQKLRHKIVFARDKMLGKKAAEARERFVATNGQEIPAGLRSAFAHRTAMLEIDADLGLADESDPEIESALESGKPEWINALAPRMMEEAKAHFAKVSAIPGAAEKYEAAYKRALENQVSVPGIINTTLRALESPMDNTAYRPGAKSWLRRNIPWYQDAKTNVQVTLRIMATSLTVGYFVQYYLWQVKFSWATALFFLVTGGITTIVHYWTDRLMMNMGVRPMSDTWSKVKYSLLYTWLTYPSYLPFFLWNNDFEKFWGNWVATPLSQNVLKPVVQTCEKILSAIF